MRHSYVRPRPIRARFGTLYRLYVDDLLFRPFCGIDGLDEGMPGRDQRGVVVVPFAANGAPVVVMQQGPRDAFPSVNGENVTIGDIAAVYRVADGIEHLDFERSGTHVHIQARQPLGRDPLYHLAVSLMPVAKA